MWSFISCCRSCKCYYRVAPILTLVILRVCTAITIRNFQPQELGLLRTRMLCYYVFKLPRQWSNRLKQLPNVSTARKAVVSQLWEYQSSPGSRSHGVIQQNYLAPVLPDLGSSVGWSWHQTKVSYKHEASGTSTPHRALLRMQPSCPADARGKATRLLHAVWKHIFLELWAIRIAIRVAPWGYLRTSGMDHNGTKIRRQGRWSKDLPPGLHRPSCLFVELSGLGWRKQKEPQMASGKPQMTSNWHFHISCGCRSVFGVAGNRAWNLQHFFSVPCVHKSVIWTRRSRSLLKMAGLGPSSTRLPSIWLNQRWAPAFSTWGREG